MGLAQLKRIDGVLMLPLTAEVQAQLSLTDDSSVELDVDGAVLVVRPEGAVPRYRLRSRYKLSELLADYDQMPRDAEEDHHWLNSPPVGRELL